MERETKFVLSHRPYAVDLDSLALEEHTDHQGRVYYRGFVDAAWFRRRRVGGFGPNGRLVTAACFGTLSDRQDVRPENGREFLELSKHNPHGGHCVGRWDGERYWGSQEPHVMEEHLRLLKPMLAAYPKVPEGFDGWWRFV